MITINLPLRAISKDNFKCQNRQGRFFLSKKYRQYEDTIRFFFKSQFPHFEPLKKDLFVQVNYYFKNKKHADLGNLQKGTLDALTGYLYGDDRQIKSLLQHIIYGNEEKIEIICVEV